MPGRLIGPGRNLESYAPAVPGVDRGHGNRHVNQFLVAKILPGFFKQGIGNAAVADRVTASVQASAVRSRSVKNGVSRQALRADALLRFAGARVDGVHVDAVSAAVDLRGTKLDQFMQPWLPANDSHIFEGPSLP